MRAHIPLIGTIWGAAIIVYELGTGQSLWALLMGVAMVLAGSWEMRRTKRRQGAHVMRRQASYGVALASEPHRPSVRAVGEASDVAPPAPADLFSAPEADSDAAK
jgi:hypothetical protein